MSEKQTGQDLENRMLKFEQSEKFFKNILNKSQDLICIAGMDGYFKYTNPTWEKIIGYTQSELLSKPFLDFIHPEDHKTNDDEVTKLMEGHDTIDFENRYIHKNGSLIKISWRATPVPEEKVIYCIGRDITRQAQLKKKLDEHHNNMEHTVKIRTAELRQEVKKHDQARALLQESEEHFRSIVENSEAGYFFIDKDGIIQNVNIAWVRLYRFDSVEEILGQHFASIQKIDDLDAAKEFVAGIMRNESQYLSGEFSRQCKDGSIGYHSFSARPVSRLGEVIGIEGFIIDTTEKKQAEEELKFSAEKFERWKNSSPIGIIQSNARGGINDVNDTILTMLGYSKQDLLEGNLDWTKLTPPEFLHLDNKAMEEAADKGFWTPFEKEYFHKDGHRVPIIIGGSVFKEYNDEYIVFVIDITKMKTAEALLRESEKKYRMLFKNMTQGVFYQNADGKLIDYNQNALDMFGLTKDQFLGKTSLDPEWKVIHEDGSDFPGDKHPSMVALKTGEQILDVIAGIFNPIKNDFVWLNISAIPQFKNGDSIPYQVFVTLHNITDLKKAEEVLQTSKDYLSNIINAIGDPVFVKDDESRFILTNDALCKILGIERENIIGKTLGESLPNNQMKHFLKIDKLVLESGQDKSCEEILTGGDGNILTIVTKKTRYVDEQGSKFIVGTIRDITERKQAETKLQHMQALLDRTNSLAQVGGWEIDIETQKLTWTKEVFTIHEADDDFVPTVENAINFYAPESQSTIQDVVGRAIEHGEPFDVELQIITAKNNWRWVHAIGKADMHDDKVVAILGVFQNITDRKKAEDEISKQKRLFETMFNTIPDGVVVTNTQREIQLANKGMESTFGYKPEELFGKSTMMLYADQSKYQETGTAVFDRNADKQGGLFLTEYQKKSGRKFSGETFGAKLFDKNSQWIGNLGIMRDITQRKQLEKKLRQTQKMESIGNLAGGIAHDFNNLLYPIIGFAEILKEDLPPDSPEHESAQEIFNAGKRGGELVKQILAFSRQSEHKMAPVRIQHVLKEVLKLSRSTIPSDIEIHQDIQQDCGSLMAESTQLHQIAMNLITNAYHAVENASGIISVQLKEIKMDADELKDSPLKPGQYAMLSVSDNGSGIPRNVINNIFDPYFTTKEKGKGTGLGLAVVYGIVKEHKGDIKVYSEEGKGTTFNVYIPLMKKFTEPVANDSVSVLPTGTERLLLVDDEESVVRLEKQMLERLGYNVVTQSSSIKALEIFKVNPDDYDLVVTDMTMPDMTGDKLAKEILAVRSDMPVIICTGFSERLNKEQAEAIGVSGFLMKPVVKSEMAQMVRKVLDETKIS